MRQPLLVSLAAMLLVAACGLINPTARPATATPAATPTRAGYPALATATPLPAPRPTLAAPTATSLAEGLNNRLGTTDPNPNCPDHYPWFFENPADECASYVLNTWAVWQPFEHGVMLWTQEAGRTYVLLDDGAPFKPYQIVSDPLGVPFPEPDPSLVPPEGYYVPERGFALFWRNLVPGHEWVRERLGWATAPEAAYSGLLQCNTATGEAARCYINGARDEIIVITRNLPWWTYVQRAVR